MCRLELVAVACLTISIAFHVTCVSVRTGWATCSYGNDVMYVGLWSACDVDGQCIDLCSFVELQGTNSSVGTTWASRSPTLAASSLVVGSLAFVLACVNISVDCAPRREPLGVIASLSFVAGALAFACARIFLQRIDEINNLYKTYPDWAAALLFLPIASYVFVAMTVMLKYCCSRRSEDSTYDLIGRGHKDADVKPNPRIPSIQSGFIYEIP